MVKMNECPKCEGELTLHKPNSKDEYLVCKRCGFRAKIKEKAEIKIGLSQLNILSEKKTFEIPLAELKIMKKAKAKIKLEVKGESEKS